MDALLVGASFVGAHLLRFGGIPPHAPTHVYLAVPVVAGLKIAVFQWFRLYQGLWAHAGTPEALQLLKASTVASGCLFGGLLVLPGNVPIAILVLDWMLTLATTGSRRFGRRAWVHYRSETMDDAKRVLIYGADRYGIFLLRYLRRVAPAQYSVVGFLDPDHTGLSVQGLPVVRTAAATNAEAIIVPVPPGSGVREGDFDPIAADCAREGLPCQQFELGIAPNASSTDDAPRASLATG
jgi:UDP-GlcNAc:undecaprenyl-phosphate GlcNAc-1-phosphate transferase